MWFISTDVNWVLDVILCMDIFCLPLGCNRFRSPYLLFFCLGLAFITYFYASVNCWDKIYCMILWIWNFTIIAIVWYWLRFLFLTFTVLYCFFYEKIFLCFIFLMLPIGNFLDCLITLVWLVSVVLVDLLSFSWVFLHL